MFLDDSSNLSGLSSLLEAVYFPPTFPVYKASKDSSPPFQSLLLCKAFPLMRACAILPFSFYSSHLPIFKSPPTCTHTYTISAKDFDSRLIIFLSNLSPGTILMDYNNHETASSHFILTTPDLHKSSDICLFISQPHQRPCHP